MYTKGGVTGLPINDFDKRQKSGEWTIDEHYRDVNYIRTRDTIPNNYLGIGNYDADEFVIYSTFLDQISTLSKPLFDNTSVICMDYSRHIDQLAIGLNKKPYLRIFDTLTGDMPDIHFLSIEEDERPYVLIRRFQAENLVSNVLHIEHNFNDSYPAICLLSTDRSISYPYETIIDDSNNISIYFDSEYDITNISGIVFVYSHPHNAVYSITDLPMSSITGQLISLTEIPSGTVEDIDHFNIYTLDISDFDHINPVFQIFNNDVCISASSIREVSTSEYEFTFPSNFDISNAKILTIFGYDSFTTTFNVNDEFDDVLINHSLNSAYFFYQIFEEDTGFLIHPENVHVKDKNKISIVTNNMSTSITYKINIVKSPPEFGIPEELLITDPPKSPVYCLQFDSIGKKLIVGVEEQEDGTHLIEYDTEDFYDRKLDLAPLKGLPTTIKFNETNNRLFIGHYSNVIDSVDRNLTLYNYETGQIISEYNFSKLKEFTSDSPTDSIFINQSRLLVISNYYEPYLHFYDYIQKENVTSKYINKIQSVIVSRVTNLAKTSDEKYLLIAIDIYPYLYILNISTMEISALPSDQFVSSFTSLSFSANDRYLCVTQREFPHVSVFNFTPTKLILVDMNYAPTKVPLTSIFFFGPISSES